MDINEKRLAQRKAARESRIQSCAYCEELIPASRRLGVLYCSPRCKHNALSARRRKTNPDYMRMYLYGVSREEYDAMLESQGGGCAICQTKVPGGKGAFHVDHDHETGVNRGLLCHFCNIGLGNFADDPNLLEDAAEYLRRA